jgi:hypothetical protein
MLASISSLAPRKVIGLSPGSSFWTEEGALVCMSTAFRNARALLTLALLGLLLGACGDPVRDRAIDELGPEVPGVPEGPLHRAGQPCVLCHSDAGGEEPFSLAGTVYIDAASATPIDGVEVHIVDSSGRKFSTITNCAGNFMARPSDYSPNFPCWVSLRSGNVFREMDSPIYREGSCAACHREPRGPSSAGRVFLIDDPTVEQTPVSQCH